MRGGTWRGAAVAGIGLISAAPAPGAGDCNTNFVTVGVGALQNGAPVAGPVHEGQTILFRAAIVVPGIDPPFVYCCVEGGTLALTLPGGDAVEAEVPAVCARMQFSLSVPYVVSAQDAAACRLTATASYRGGAYLSDPPVPGAGGSASLTLELERCCPGDANGDGWVDVADLVEVVIAWGPCRGHRPADIDGDGAVGVVDLIGVILSWGPCG
jgi:hypothetical protein